PRRTARHVDTLVVAPRTTHVVTLGGGSTATVWRRPNGGVAAIHTRDLVVTKPLVGVRTVVEERPDRRVVACGRQVGYAQRPWVERHGVDYVRRTYVVENVTYVNVYRSYHWGGDVFYGYVPRVYWTPVYYRWAYDPWSVPVVYDVDSWGWHHRPWWGYYGSYFV